ncbi:MAG: 4Fe-4S binding protein [Candidatus Omnitrophica bacterium]|nr:4Fe-4S binding protein [Candidatus Omnitrophota bacterium]MBU4458173.1 4Fe-4S binding protein [Candidatus Omnitrophota bacterium]
MAKRKIVKIDEEKCTGCGLCIPNCAERALQIVDGKAKLVKEIYCDGLGACLGHCPENAITIEERESAVFDEKATEKHLKDLKKKEKKSKDLPCGCPGTAVKTLKKRTTSNEQRATKTESELSNWPIQLMLVPTEAPYLKNADLLIAADCVAFSYPDFHQDFLKGRILLMGCPKLDAATIYEEKLAEIFKLNDIKSITLLHMEVPCCFGLNQIVSEALRLSGKKIPLKEVTVGIKGDVK